MGNIAKTYGKICQNCGAFKGDDIKYCVSCFSRYVRPLEVGYCPKCLDPRPPEKQNYLHCWTCKNNLDNNRYFLDGVLSCGYYIDKDSDFGFALHAYKGSGMPECNWMTFPLAALTYSFLQRHYDCIQKHYGRFNAIVPIPGHAEKLLFFCRTFPIAQCLHDTKTDRQSTGGERGFDPNRFKVGNTAPKKILLFDDVLTRGGTAHSAAYALKNAGAASVTLFTLAKRLGNTRELLSDTYESFSVERCQFCN